MKKGWVEKKLIEIASVTTGKYDANHAVENGQFRFYTCAYNYGMCNTNRFSGESLILPGNGVNVGEVFYYDGEFDAYQRTYVINDIKIFPKYLHYHMLLFWKELGTKLQYGSATNFIKIGNFQNYRVLYPPLPEQQRIVSILDEAFAAIAKAKANTEQNLKNAKELFESYLAGLFEMKGDGWVKKTLGEVCEYEKISNKRYDLPYVGLEDIQSNTGVFIGPYEARNMKSLTFYFNNKHVLYGRLRPYLNKVLLPDFEGHCSTEIFPIKPKENVLDRGFLFQWLMSTDTMNKINATWTGATLPRANMNAVLEFKINIPPLKDQHNIVQKLGDITLEIKKIETIYQNKIYSLEELKKSILEKAFLGEL